MQESSNDPCAVRLLRAGCGRARIAGVGLVVSQIGSWSLWSLWAKGRCGGQPCGRRSPSIGVVHGGAKRKARCSKSIVHKSTGAQVSQLRNHAASNSLRNRATASGFRSRAPAERGVRLGSSNSSRPGSAKTLYIQVRPCRSKSDPTSRSKSRPK